MQVFILYLYYNTKRNLPVLGQTYSPEQLVISFSSKIEIGEGDLDRKNTPDYIICENIVPNLCSTVVGD